MQVSELIDRVDVLLVQAGVVEASRRWQQAEVFDWIEDGQRTIIQRIPAAGSQTTNITLVDGAKQSIPATWEALLDVDCNKSGNNRKRSVNRVDKDTLDAVAPGWQQLDQETEVEEYMYNPGRDPRVFWVYPPVDAGVQIEATGTRRVSAISATTDDLVIQDQFVPALANLVIHRALSKQAEYANLGTAGAYYQAAMADLGGS